MQKQEGFTGDDEIIAILGISYFTQLIRRQCGCDVWVWGFSTLWDWRPSESSQKQCWADFRHRTNQKTSKGTKRLKK